MGVLRVGKRQGSLQVQGHDVRSGRGGAQGQQLPDEVGGLRCWAAASSAAHQGPEDLMLLALSSIVQHPLAGVLGTGLCRVLCDVAAWTCWPVPLGSACPSKGRCEGGHFYAEPFGNRGDVATVSWVGSRTWGLLLWLPVGLARVSCRRPSVPQK